MRPERPEQRAHRFAIARGDDLHRIGREAPLRRALLGARAPSAAFELRGLGATAQEHRVAALDAQRRGVDGHVRARAS